MYNLKLMRHVFTVYPKHKQKWIFWMAARTGHCNKCQNPLWDYLHYNDVIMGAMASQITNLIESTKTTSMEDVSIRVLEKNKEYSWLFTQPFIQGADQRKHQSSASLAFVGGIHRWPVNSTHKGPVTWKMFPFDDAIMWEGSHTLYNIRNVLMLKYGRFRRLLAYCILVTNGWWPIYVSVNLFNTDTCNGLVPVWCQAIT